MRGVVCFELSSGLLYCYHTHHHNKFGTFPEWGTELVKEILMKTKKKYEFGAGLHSRIPQSYKVMIVWAALDQGTMKAFWKSVKGVCPKDAKSATQIRKDALDKFKTILFPCKQNCNFKLLSVTWERLLFSRLSSFDNNYN